MKTFDEEYIVKFDLFNKEKGYWTMSREESVFVEVEHGVNEKNNHRKAANIIKEMYPDSRIKRVLYV